MTITEEYIKSVDGHRLVGSTYLFASRNGQYGLPRVPRRLITMIHVMSCPYCGSQLLSYDRYCHRNQRGGWRYNRHECGVELAVASDDDLPGSPWTISGISKRTPGCLLRTGYTEDEDAI